MADRSAITREVDRLVRRRDEFADRVADPVERMAVERPGGFFFYPPSGRLVRYDTMLRQCRESLDSLDQSIAWWARRLGPPTGRRRRQPRAVIRREGRR